jgi:hypothetical protein
LPPTPAPSPTQGAARNEDTVLRICLTLRGIAAQAGAELPAGINPDLKILLRVFFAVEGARIVLLLRGYDKGADPSGKRQDREIKLARTRFAHHLHRFRRTVGHAVMMRAAPRP